MSSADANRPPSAPPLHAVSWRDLCPWLLLFRTFSVAIAPSVLALGTVAVLIVPLGWRLAAMIALSDETPTEVRQMGASWEALPWEQAEPPVIANTLVARAFGPTMQFFDRLRLLGAQLRDELMALNMGACCYLLIGMAWTLLVASLLGGAISRKSVVVLGREDRVSLGDALRHAGRRLGGYLLAPLYPLLIVALLTAGCGALGLLMRVSALAAVASFLWPLALLAGAAIAILLVGVFVGWPLMWGAVSAEEDGEAFEALSRAYSYVYGRPLHLAFYAVVATIVGALGLAVVRLFVHATLDATIAAVDWGAAGEMQEMVRSGGADWMRRTAATLVNAQNTFVGAMTAGFQFAFFWVASAAIYLLIRSDVDHTELDEVYMPDDGQGLSLPSLQLDASGAVAVKSEAEAQAGGDSEAEQRP